MWCKNCQQDVPGIASPDEQLVRCAKCQRALSAGANEGYSASDPPSQDASAASGASLDSFAMLDDWELEDDLNEAQHLVHSVGVDSSESSHRRVDPTPDVSLQHSSSSRAKKVSRGTGRPARSSIFSWLMLSLGMMAFVFGSVLLGWSFATERADLWRLGMPFTLAGQVGLIIGLVFQLDGLWRSNRLANETLNELDSQLVELRHTTAILSTTKNMASQSFYVHMAEGASPTLLLADLKGQLDLLASRLAEER